jgi:hypothetical protein
MFPTFRVRINLLLRKTVKCVNVRNPMLRYKGSDPQFGYALNLMLIYACYYFPWVSVSTNRMEYGWTRNQREPARFILIRTFKEPVVDVTFVY